MRAIEARFLELSEAREECIIVPIDEVAKYVHFVARNVGAHLDAGNQREVPVTRGCVERFG
jgi:hypothetical protein